jgi:DNA repair exonuclease SbcCD nuclease subunit
MRAPQDDDVALKLLHTADWHLGKRFPQFDEHAELELMRARMSVLDEVFGVAERNRVDAVLCAGDLFDGPEPDPQWWEPLLDRLARREHVGRPIVLLPGNHDPLTHGSVWDPEHPFRRGLPPGVHVVDRDDFTLELGPEAVLHAIPCRSKAGSADLALQLPERAAGDERIRIGLVHGSTFEMPSFQTNFPIARDAAERRGFDYLAIGDTHAFRVYPPEHAPTVYPSAPEPTTFGEPDAGHVAVVFFPRKRRRPIVRKERVARYRWEERTIHDMPSLRQIGSVEDLQRCVLRVVLDMRVSAAEYDEALAILRRLRGTHSVHGRVAVLQADTSALRLDTSSIHTELADLPEVLRKTAARLRELEASGDGEVARRALFHLYRLARAQGPEAG